MPFELGPAGTGLRAGARGLAEARIAPRAAAGHAVEAKPGGIGTDPAVGFEAARPMIRHDARCSRPARFPDPLPAAQAELLPAGVAVTGSEDPLHLGGSASPVRADPKQRHVRDGNMVTIAGRMARIPRDLVAGDIRGMRIPHTRVESFGEAGRRRAAQ